MDYKDRLVCLDMLPLMYVLELNDVLFCIKSLKETSPSFNIRNFITFSKCSTRSGKVQKMNLPQTSTTMQKHHYFNRLPKLWNSLPPIDLDLSVDVSNNDCTSTSMNNSRKNSSQSYPALSTSFVLVQNVHISLTHLLLNFKH